MELESIPQFLENKTILVTGATGFIAKAFVEKILRLQPNVKRLYLLIRASDIASATQRLHNEVIEKDLFRVVREKWGENLDSFISDKVFAVPGDISDENLGVKDSKLREDMWKSKSKEHPGPPTVKSLFMCPGLMHCNISPGCSQSPLCVERNRHHPKFCHFHIV